VTVTIVRRKEDRINCEHPVNLGDTKGITRNISASGVYFVTNSFYMPGNLISFTVEFDSPGGKLLLKCDGQVIRIEPRDGEVGVAVKILKSVMMPGPVGSQAYEVDMRAGSVFASAVVVGLFQKSHYSQHLQSR